VYDESSLRTIVKGTTIGVLYVAVIGMSLLALFNIVFAVVR
jgi:tetrahydromethanopterin S-methyltransferase subunit G